MSASRALPVFVGLFAFFTPFSIAAAHTSLAVATVLLLADRDARRHVAPLRRHPLALPVLFWCLVSLSAVVFALDPVASAPKLKKLALLTLLPLGALPVVRDAIRPIVVVLIASTAIVAIWGLVQFAIEGAGLDARIHGIFGFYMTVAGILMLVALLATAEILAALKDPNRRRLAFLTISGVAILAALAGTYTRGSWIGFLAGFVYLMRKRRMLLLGLAIVAGLLLIGSPGAREDALGIVDPGHPRNQERVVIWQHGVGLLDDHPITGVGLVIPRDVLERRVVLPDGAIALVHSHLHNVYLQIAVSMGWPGLAVFGWLVFMLFRTAVRAERSAVRNLWEQGLVSAVPACLVAMLVNGLFEWNFGDSEILGLLYLLAGLTLGIESSPDA